MSERTLASMIGGAAGLYGLPATLGCTPARLPRVLVLPHRFRTRAGLSPGRVASVGPAVHRNPSLRITPSP